MRDEDEKRRFMEQQLREGERSQFRKLRNADSMLSGDSPQDGLLQTKDKALSKYGSARLQAAAEMQE